MTCSHATAAAYVKSFYGINNQPKTGVTIQHYSWDRQST